MFRLFSTLLSRVGASRFLYIHQWLKGYLLIYLFPEKLDWRRESEREREREGGEQMESAVRGGGGDCLLLMPCGNMAELYRVRHRLLDNCSPVSLLVCSSSTCPPSSHSPSLSLSLCASPQTHTFLYVILIFSLFQTLTPAAHFQLSSSTTLRMTQWDFTPAKNTREKNNNNNETRKGNQQKNKSHRPQCR